jgi:hypothetical protein
VTLAPWTFRCYYRLPIPGQVGRHDRACWPCRTDLRWITHTTKKVVSSQRPCRIGGLERRDASRWQLTRDPLGHQVALSGDLPIGEPSVRSK